MINVSSIIKKCAGYEIELSITKSIFIIFSYIYKEVFFCGGLGCFHKKTLSPVRDKKILEILEAVYNSKKNN